MKAYSKIKIYAWVLFFTLGTVLSIPIASRSQSSPPPGPSPTETSAAPSPQNPPEVKKSDDFEYYKKYGRSSKAWNDMVKNGFEAYELGDCEKVLSYLKEAAKAGCDDPIVLFKL